jgi:REP element-mobilizing transposase RayT
MDCNPWAFVFFREWYHFAMGHPPWNNWFHCTGSTYGAWLRGDPRGWRARHHRQHVNGDYKRPPPPDAYTRLLAYSKFIMKRDAIILDWPQRLAAARKMVEALQFHNVQVIDLCVSPTHFHVLCRFTPLRPGIAIPGLVLNPRASTDRKPRHLIGIAKKESARALSKIGLTGSGGIWAVRCKCKPIRNRLHQLRVARYIPAHIKRGAAVMSIHIRPRVNTRQA